MTKPPKSTAHSDLDGVREDERRNVDSANDAGQDIGDLARAKRESVGRPPHTEEANPEDRSR